MSNLFLFVGPSGSGKTTVARHLDAPVAVSLTTRGPRPGEQDGVDYWFVTPEEFESRVNSEAVEQHINYAGNRYGLDMNILRQQLIDNPTVIAIVDPDGAKFLTSWALTKSALDIKVVLVYFDTGTPEDLETRLIARGDSPESIKTRMTTLDHFETIKPKADIVLTSTNIPDLLEELNDKVSIL